MFTIGTRTTSMYGFNFGNISFLTNKQQDNLIIIPNICVFEKLCSSLYVISW